MAARAVYTAAVGDGGVFCAKRVRGTDADGFQRVLNLSAQSDGLAELDQAAERAFAVRGGGVDEDAGHGAVLLANGSAAETLAHAGGGIAAFERNLAHEGVRE